MRLPLALAAVLFLIPGIASAAYRRLNLDSKPPFVLSGMLTFKVFPGAPNFEDVRSGDQPEPTYILKLDEPVCVTGGAQGAQPSEPISSVHVTAPFDGSNDTVTEAFRSLKGRHVAVTAKSLDVATTGHHHAPLLAEVTSAVPDGEGIPGMEQPGTTTVRGFYGALAAGDGTEAAKFVVPELRSRGPLSADAMSAYYSTLRSPLKLRDVRPLSADTFEASYTFASRSGACDGRSVVTVVRRGDLMLISRVRSLTGC